MKKYLFILFSVFAIAFAPGCKTSSSPQRITFNAASTAVISVDTALKAWASFAVSQRAAAHGDAAKLAALDAKEERVRSAYGAYQAAALSIVTGQMSLTNSPNASTITTTALASAGAPLLWLISQFLTPSTP